MPVNSTHFRDGKKTFRSIPKKGNAMGICATFNTQYICCGVHVLNSVQNCPFECSYCFLQNYLTDGTLKSVEDIDQVLKEIKVNISKMPWRLFRIGSWELGDSLALENQNAQAGLLIPAFARLHNAILELKTKSDCVESILALNHRRKTVVSWSLNTDSVISSDEYGTASLARRLEAIKKTAKAGYLIGLHFDPMIYYDDWEHGYAGLVDEVFNTVSADNIAWISIGSLRFNPEMKKKIENNYPHTRLTCAEMVLGNDAKMRYVKPLRRAMYSRIYEKLKEHISENTLVYLCMERWDMWERVFGYRPDSAQHLDYLFAKSLYERYGLGPRKPERTLYDSGRT